MWGLYVMFNREQGGSRINYPFKNEKKISSLNIVDMAMYNYIIEVKKKYTLTTHKSLPIIFIK